MRLFQNSTAENRKEEGLLTTLHSLPKAAWILFAGTFINKFGTFVIPFLTLYITRRGHTMGDAGLAIGAYGIGTLLACGLGGYLADHIGRRKTIALSMFSAAATMLLLSRANSLYWIVSLTGLNAVAAEFYRPASSALLSDLVPAHQRITAFGAYRLAFNAGWAFGPATAGFLADHSFSWLFIGDALTSILFGLVAWFALPHGVRVVRQESGWKIAIQDFRRNPRFLRVLLASLFIAPIFYQLSSTYGLYVTGLGFSPAVYGALISFNGILIVCFELPLTTVTRRFPAKRCMALGYLLTGLGFSLNALATTIPALLIGITIFSLGEMIALPVGSAYVAELAPTHMRGRYMGAVGLTWALALIFAPALGMSILAHSPTPLWIGCGLSGLIAALLIYWPRERLVDR